MSVRYVIFGQHKRFATGRQRWHFLHSYAYSQICLYSCFVIYHRVDWWKCVFTWGDKPPSLLNSLNLNF